jgi:ubiquinone/menaquinone biosynthesis C-methylase UbiE
MDADLQRRIQRYGWDKAAESYEPFWHRQLEPAQSLLLRLAAPSPGERVLDVACGTGIVSFRAAALVGERGSVLGTDISDNMVARARAAAEGRPNVTFARMDAERLEVEPATFDVALCGLGLMYFPDPARALAGMFGAVRPGGRAAAAVWGARASCGWAEIFPIVDARVRSEVCPMFFQTGTGETLARLFAQAGFADVRAERIRTVLRYDSDEEALGAAFVGGPVALAYSRFDPEIRRAVHREYLDSIAPFASGNGYDVPGEFVVAAGTRP